MGTADSSEDWLRLHGGEIFGFLTVMLRSETLADEAYARFSEDFWRGLPTFREDCGLRTWAYVLARRAGLRVLRDLRRNREVPLSYHSYDAQFAQPQRTDTAPWRKTAFRDRVRQIREQLHPDDQALLTLRLDRALDWTEIARVLLNDDEMPASPEALRRKSAALRKRFERVKTEIQALVQGFRAEV